MVQQALDAVCEQVAGCKTVAFSDLSTQMVLVTNTGTSLHRDALNALCQQAHACLATGAQEGLIGTESGLHVFVRSSVDPTEALCCICALDTDIDQLLSALSDCFDTLNAGANPS